ncbi:MAG: hypothetical protein KGY38_02265 [Desulfobacterales bacterium]|nr:hypothetical protein [Desulfobacterales bacterium]
MESEPGPQKRKTYRWVGYLCVIAAALGGVALIINPSLINVAVEIILLINVGVHWKYIFASRGRDQQGPG